MGKKSNGGPGQNGKPIPIPNREIIQRMNFLHQAAVLVSGALHTPTASTSRVRIDAPHATEARQKQAATAQKAKDMEQIGQLIATQRDVEVPKKATIRTQRKTVLGVSNSKEEETTGQRRESHFIQYLHNQGLIVEEIQVKLNKRKKSYLRKQAKAKMASLQFGIVPYTEYTDTTSTSSNEAKQGRKDLPLHPSQIENRSLACHYVNDIRLMARKNVLRMDPTVKRTMCRNCNALLVPGLTSKIKILPSASHVHVIRTHCLACNVARTIPCPPERANTREDIEAAVMHGDASAMREDATPSSAATSRTLSDQSRDMGDFTPVPSAFASTESGGDNPDSVIGTQSPTVASDKMAGQAMKAPAPNKRAMARQKRKMQRTKTAARPTVPGRKGQYSCPRFHERPEHLLVEVNKPSPASS